MTSARLVVVCGLPGSGKTTLAKRLETSMRAIRFCPDEWLEVLSIDVRDEGRRDQIEALQWQLAQDLLTLGVTVILEWGTWGRLERDKLRLGARAIGVPVELHSLSASLEELFKRVCLRGKEVPSITREEMQQWSKVFQVPTSEEIALFDEHTAE